MGAAELVRGTDQHVGAERGHVDRPVRRVVDGVDPRQRAGVVGEADDPGGVLQRAYCVRGPRERDDARAVRKLPLEVVEVERAVVVDVGEADDQAEIVRELQPGRHVRVVVEPGDDDLVAGMQLARSRAREREVERRHVRAECDLPRRAAQPFAGREPRVGDHGLRSATRLVGPADVRVRLAKVAGDRVDHLVGNLRPARSVEEREAASERRETRPDRVDVEGDRGHPLTLTDRVRLAVPPGGLSAA
jgi:hypothetical protein